ncbi:MAG TPA: hypothetical protein VMZ91_07865 [Candidatus Paceibacterota bacterium]|nr:hypothetical protein [Candidatus Paceibacterota bacterium]
MNKIEKLKNFHEISSYLNNNSQQKLKKELGIDVTDNVRLSGLRAEDEFLLILLFLECCNNIVKIEQGISRLVNPKSIPPDLLCTFNYGLKNAFIEVKKTKKDFWKISRTDFQKRKSFVQSYKIPLYFAVRIRSFWGLFSSEYIEEQGLKIYTKDYKNNLFDKYTDNFAVIFPYGIEIKSIYSKLKEGIGGGKNQYGNLIYWEIKYKDKSVVINKEERNKLIWKFIMWPIEDYLLLDSSNITKQGNYTIIEKKLKNNLIVNSYLFFLSIIRHTIYKKDYPFNASSLLKQLKENKNYLYRIPNKSVILSVLNDIKSIVPLIIYKTKVE